MQNHTKSQHKTMQQGLLLSKARGQDITSWLPIVQKAALPLVNNNGDNNKFANTNAKTNNLAPPTTTKIKKTCVFVDTTSTNTTTNNCRNYSNDYHIKTSTWSHDQCNLRWNSQAPWPLNINLRCCRRCCCRCHCCYGCSCWLLTLLLLVLLSLAVVVFLSVVDGIHAWI